MKRFESIYKKYKICNETERLEFKFRNRHDIFNAYTAPARREERYDLLNNSLTLMLVRHPFERLLSAYTGKIASPFVRQHHETRKEIIKKYRTDPSDRSLVPSFREFILYILDVTDRGLSPKQWAYIVTWRPYYSICLPCNVTYDVIIELANQKEEERYVFAVKQDLEFLDTGVWEHNSNTNRDSRSEAMFAELSKNEVKLLYERYKIDMEMFNYTIDKYINYAF